jgi:hypothetical protein
MRDESKESKASCSHRSRSISIRRLFVNPHLQQRTHHCHKCPSRLDSLDVVVPFELHFTLRPPWFLGRCRMVLLDRSGVGTFCFRRLPLTPPVLRYELQVRSLNFVSCVFPLQERGRAPSTRSAAHVAEAEIP